MKGGIIQINNEHSLDDDLQFFLDNSSIDLLTKEAENQNGIILLITLNLGIESPFFTNRSNYVKKPVTKMLLKLCVISDTKELFELGENNVCKHGLRYQKSEQFLKETNIQSQIFQKTLNEYLEPDVPCILKSSINTELHIVDDLSSKTSNIDLQNFLASLKSNLDSSDKVGLIYMEMLDGFITLYDVKDRRDRGVIDEVKLNSILQLVLYEFYKLSKHLIRHNDPHGGNILCNLDYDYLYKGSGRVILIDFGKSIKESDKYEAWAQQIGIPETIEHQYRRSVGGLKEILLELLNIQYDKFSFEKEKTNLLDPFVNIPAMSLSEINEKRRLNEQKFLEHVKTASSENKGMVQKGGYNYFNEIDPHNIFTFAYINNYIKILKYNLTNNLKNLYKKTRQITDYRQYDKFNNLNSELLNSEMNGFNNTLAIGVGGRIKKYKTVTRKGKTRKNKKTKHRRYRFNKKSKKSKKY